MIAEALKWAILFGGVATLCYAVVRDYLDSIAP